MMQQRSLIPDRHEGPTELVPFDRDAGDGKQITMTAVKALVAWAERYHLDPYAGHVCFMFNQPYVTERGAMANARRHKDYRGCIVTLVHPEEKEAMGLTREDVAYRCEVLVEGLTEPMVEFGEVTNKEIQEAMAKYGDRAAYLPLVKSPGKLARARAIRRAHLLAYPLDVPTPG